MKKLQLIISLLFTINLHAYNPEHLAKYQRGDTDLQNLDLSGAMLQKANFENKNLSGTNLSDANLFFANFSNANLTNTKFKFAFAIYTNFSGADLIGADLTNIVCAFTNFSNVIGLTNDQKEYLKHRDAIFNQHEWEEKIKFFTTKTDQKNEIKRHSCLKNILNRLAFCCCCRKDSKK